jgi:hypothetical protein
MSKRTPRETGTIRVRRRSDSIWWWWSLRLLLFPGLATCLCRWGRRCSKEGERKAGPVGCVPVLPCLFVFAFIIVVMVNTFSGFWIVALFHLRPGRNLQHLTRDTSMCMTVACVCVLYVIKFGHPAQWSRSWSWSRVMVWLGLAAPMSVITGGTGTLLRINYGLPSSTDRWPLYLVRVFRLQWSFEGAECSLNKQKDVACCCLSLWSALNSHGPAMVILKRSLYSNVPPWSFHDNITITQKSPFLLLTQR